MVYAEADEFRRVGNGSIARGGVAHGKDSHLCRHPVEIPHAFCDRVVGQGPAEPSVGLGA